MLDNSEDFKTLVYTVTEIAKENGRDIAFDLLSNGQITIEQSDYDSWDGGTYIYTVYIVIDVKGFIRIKDQIASVERQIEDYFTLATRHIRGERISKIILVPQASIVTISAPNPHRPFSIVESQRRADLLDYLNTCTEDELIEQILLPLFRQLGFYRITSAGHKDKALEYGKDVWMKYTLPTQHILYFGIQVKKGKLDASGVSKSGNTNIAEILNQVLMMIGHEIFDPEAGRRVLVDHAFIVAGGEITKQAKNWLGEKLDASKRSQIMFMDRDDILNLFCSYKFTVTDSCLERYCAIR